MPKMKRVLPVSLAVILIALVVVGGITVFGRSGGRTAASVPPKPRPGRAGDVAATPPREGLPSFPAMRELLFNPQMDAAAVKMFRAYAAYPPDSRPLAGNEADILQPFGFPPAPRTLDGAACALHASLHTVAEGQTNVVRLFCQDPRDPKRHLPLVVHDAAVVLPGQTAAGAAASAGAAAPTRPVEFNDSGRDGDERPSDNVHTWTFVPGSTHAGDVDVTVRFALAGGAETTGAGGGNGGTAAGPRIRQLRASFLSSPVAPARFTGRVRDRLVDGSLMVDVELDVHRSGRFAITANLYAGEVAVGYATGDAKLEPGRRSIPLRFFGKMFRDRLPGDQANRAFELVALRGTRSNLPFDPLDLATLPPSEIARIIEAAPPTTGPDREVIPPWPGRIKTQSYALSQFSPDEWRSPVKDRRLAEMQQTAENDDFGQQ